MKTRYLVYRKGYEGEWYLQKDYKKDDGYEMYFNLDVFTIRKDGFIVMQGGAQNFMYEIDKYEDNDS